MRFLILLATVPLASASPPPGTQASPGPVVERSPASLLPLRPLAERDCPSTSHMAREVVIDAAPRKLGELPPGQLEYAVLRQIAGCPIPAVIRSGIGSRPVRTKPNR